MKADRRPASPHRATAQPGHATRPIRLAAVLVALAVAGCGPQQMTDQPRLEPLEASDFFPNQQGSRHLVEGTVSRGHRRDQITQYSQHLLTGIVDGQTARELPAELPEDEGMHEVLVRGRQRYEIFCSHCHDLVGTGEGMVPQRGYPSPPTFHSQRLRQAPLGHFFQVISTGKGRMPPHAGQIPPADRWRIAAYVRALQLSQHVPVAELEAEELERIEQTTATAGESK